MALQWTPQGTVWWDDVSVEEVSAPAPRRIKVATVSYQPPEHSTPEKNRLFYAETVAVAGKRGIDLLCLGEGITVVLTGKVYADVAEPRPGLAILAGNSGNLQRIETQEILLAGRQYVLFDVSDALNIIYCPHDTYRHLNIPFRDRRQVFNRA